MKRSTNLLLIILLIVCLASTLALAAPGKGPKGNTGHENDGVPDVALALMVGTGIVAVGIYAKRKLGRK